MTGLLSGLLSLGRRGGAGTMDYGKAKRLAADPDKGVRRGLARRADVQPEILYFLAEDSDEEVRREIAANPSTPVQADALLAGDRDEDVRLHIARKIGRLAPGLTEDETKRAGDIVTGILEKLARDEAAAVRRALADELKSVRNVPPSVVERLARDDDHAVSGPVLRNSPLLSDAFLMEIISSRPVRAALAAISERPGLGADVADAIVGTDDRAAITSLLRNRSAQIREETLDRLVDGAIGIEEWHAPLVARPNLSARAAGTLSRFVTEVLLEELLNRNDLDPEVSEAVRENVQRRLDAAGPGDADPDATRETPAERAHRLHRAGTLDEAEVKAALMRGDRPFVLESLACLSGLPGAVVQKAFSLGSAKGVSAVSWKAGLSADLALQLQLRLARIAPPDALRPSGGGYALSAADLDWQIEFLGG